MGRESVKGLLDYILNDHGIYDNHELYEVFDIVFRMGLTWGGNDGGTPLVKVLFRNEKDGYLYAVNNGNGGVILEDDYGNVIAGGAR